MDWRSKRVLITGAGGFIGSHLVECMVATGATVTAFVRYNSRSDDGSLGFLPAETRSRVHVQRGDLKDPDAVRRVVQGQQVVFHLAALIGIPYSYVHPLDYVQTNVVGTALLLSACAHEGVERLVHTSTSEVYGTARHVPIDEDHALQGQSPYSASKIAADQLALSYYRSFDLPVTVLRPFNTYGPRQPARAIIPTIMGQALSGNDVSLGSLTPTRDLTFVSDTVAAFLAAAECERALGEVINIGSSREISIGDLAGRIIDLVGEPVRVVDDPQRVRPPRSEVERLCANTTKARSLLGWTPQVTLDEGLVRTVAWVREHPSFLQTDTYQV